MRVTAEEIMGIIRTEMESWINTDEYKDCHSPHFLYHCGRVESLSDVEQMVWHLEYEREETEKPT